MQAAAKVLEQRLLLLQYATFMISSSVSSSFTSSFCEGKSAELELSWIQSRETKQIVG